MGARGEQLYRAVIQREDMGPHHMGGEPTDGRPPPGICPPPSWSAGVCGGICGGGVCSYGGCFTEADCPPGHGCVQKGLSKVCAQGCLTDAQCDSWAGERCKHLPEGWFCAQKGYGDIGEACESFEDCASNFGCFPWTNGYCAPANCGSGAPCPAGTFCMTGNDEGIPVCALECGEGLDVTCRTAESYNCVYTVTTAGDLVRGCLPAFVYGI